VAEPINYRVRRVKRSRRVKVRVDPQDGVEVLLPARAPLAAAGEAVAELAPWIERERRRLAGLRERHAQPGTLPYLDERLRVLEQPGRTRAHRSGDTLLVPAADGAARRAIELWYRREARAEIAWRLDAAAAQAGTPYTRLTIRNQRTRWASCASGGAMSFNWRLMLGPADVLDYVVWHEVCHLRQADHSPAFWGLLERHCPQWRPAAAWLRENGPALVL
jgi:predicted metal-dependent hydrolase